MCLIFSVMFRPVDVIEVPADEEENLAPNQHQQQQQESKQIMPPVPDIIEPPKNTEDTVGVGINSVNYIYQASKCLSCDHKSSSQMKTKAGINM